MGDGSGRKKGADGPMPLEILRASNARGSSRRWTFPGAAVNGALLRAMSCFLFVLDGLGVDSKSIGMKW